MATGRRDRWMIAALGLLALLPFLRTLTFGYVLDDTTIIRGNQYIRGWSSLISLWSQPYWAGGPDQAGLYRPVILALFATIWNSGLHVPFWFHLFALSLHVVVTVLVWRLLRDGVGKWPAALAAAWFALHPVHIEAVANITNSSEVLVALWTLLLALLAKRVAATRDASDEPTRGVGWSSAIVLAVVFAAACLTKESGTVAPALVACWLWGWRGASNSRQSFVQTISVAAERWWRVIVACVFVVAGVVVVRTIVLGGLVSGGTIAAPGLDRLSATERVWSMLSLGPTVATLLIWPTTINPHYGPTFIDGHSGPTASALLTLFVLASLMVIGLVLARRDDRRLLVALAWMTIAFLPASNLLVATGQIFAERTLYGSSVGVAMLVGLALDAVSRSMTIAGSQRAALIRVGAVATLVVLALTGIRTMKFARVWRDHPTVFNQMVVADPAGYRGYWLLGMHQRSRGQPDSAIALLGRAYSLYPRDRQLLIDFSETLLQRGDARRAASVAAGLMDWPALRKQPEAIALYLDAMGRAFGPDSVVIAGERLFATEPSATTALFLGAAQEAKGDRDAAIAAYRRGLQTAPADSALRAKLALVR